MKPNVTENWHIFSVCRKNSYESLWNDQKACVHHHEGHLIFLEFVCDVSSPEAQGFLWHQAEMHKRLTYQQCKTISFRWLEQVTKLAQTLSVIIRCAWHESDMDMDGQGCHRVLCASGWDDNLSVYEDLGWELADTIAKWEAILKRLLDSQRWEASTGRKPACYYIPYKDQFCMSRCIIRYESNFMHIYLRICCLQTAEMLIIIRWTSSN